MKVFSVQQQLQDWSWFFKIAFYSALFIGCYMAFTPVDGGIQAKFNDKVLHAIGFLVMALISQLAHPKTKFMLLGFGLGCFGLAIELVQAYLPYRSFSMWDWLADMLGVIVYFILFAHLLRDKSVLD